MLIKEKEELFREFTFKKLHYIWVLQDSTKDTTVTKHYDKW